MCRCTEIISPARPRCPSDLVAASWALKQHIYAHHPGASDDDYAAAGFARCPVASCACLVCVIEEPGRGTRPQWRSGASTHTSRRDGQINGGEAMPAGQGRQGVPKAAQADHERALGLRNSPTSFRGGASEFTLHMTACACNRTLTPPCNRAMCRTVSGCPCMCARRMRPRFVGVRVYTKERTHALLISLRVSTINARRQLRRRAARSTDRSARWKPHNDGCSRASCSSSPIHIDRGAVSAGARRQLAEASTATKCGGSPRRTRPRGLRAA